MSRAAHPQAMRSAKPGRTRTAPPRLPDQFPMDGRYRTYTLFGATGILYLMLGFIILGVVGSLGAGAEQWRIVLEKFRSPVYIGFHAISLAAVCFVAVRFFRLFPKAQPPRIGPVKPPPARTLLGMLYAVWLGVTLVFSAILAGAIF